MPFLEHLDAFVKFGVVWFPLIHLLPHFSGLMSRPQQHLPIPLILNLKAHIVIGVGISDPFGLVLEGDFLLHVVVDNLLLLPEGKE